MRILVPLDSSTFSQAAQRVAFQLGAEIENAQLRAIHVVNVRTASGNLLSDIPGYAGFEPAIVNPEVYQAHMDAAAAMVAQFVNRAKSEGLTAEGEVLTGAVTPAIVDASHHADLVVMGLRGESDDRFPGQGGAQANNALPKISVPVVLVPRHVTRISGIAVGYDASAGAAHALKAAARLAGLDVPFHLIHVGAVGDDDPLDAAIRFLPDALENSGKVVKHYVNGDSVHGALVQATRDSRANLLALGFRGDDPLKNALFGSSREHLLDHSSPVALLITK